MAPRRIGGHGRADAGEAVTWTSAAGARGTRWREVIRTAEGRVRTVLLEESTDGAPTRLEIASVAGLLTMHPGPDGSSIHGNVVSADGVRHITLGWRVGHVLLVAGSPVTAAVGLRGQFRAIAVGGTAAAAGVWVDDALEPHVGRWAVTRVDTGVWRLEADDGSPAFDIRVDAEGLPVLDGASAWPLET